MVLKQSLVKGPGIAIMQSLSIDCKNGFSIGEMNALLRDKTKRSSLESFTLRSKNDDKFVRYRTLLSALTD